MGLGQHKSRNAQNAQAGGRLEARSTAQPVTVAPGSLTPAFERSLDGFRVYQLVECGLAANTIEASAV